MQPSPCRAYAVLGEAEDSSVLVHGRGVSVEGCDAECDYTAVADVGEAREFMQALAPSLVADAIHNSGSVVLFLGCHGAGKTGLATGPGGLAECVIREALRRVGSGAEQFAAAETYCTAYEVYEDCVIDHFGPPDAYETPANAPRVSDVQVTAISQALRLFHHARCQSSNYSEPGVTGEPAPAPSTSVLAMEVKLRAATVAGSCFLTGITVLDLPADSTQEQAIAVLRNLSAVSTDTLSLRGSPFAALLMRKMRNRRVHLVHCLGSDGCAAADPGLTGEIFSAVSDARARLISRDDPQGNYLADLSSHQCKFCSLTLGRSVTDVLGDGDVVPGSGADGRDGGGDEGVKAQARTQEQAAATYHTGRGAGVRGEPEDDFAIGNLEQSGVAGRHPSGPTPPTRTVSFAEHQPRPGRASFDDGPSSSVVLPSEWQPPAFMEPSSPAPQAPQMARGRTVQYQRSGQAGSGVTSTTGIGVGMRSTGFDLDMSHAPPPPQPHSRSPVRQATPFTSKVASTLSATRRAYEDSLLSLKRSEARRLELQTALADIETEISELNMRAELHLATTQKRMEELREVIRHTDTPPSRSASQQDPLRFADQGGILDLQRVLFACEGDLKALEAQLYTAITEASEAVISSALGCCPKDSGAPGLDPLVAELRQLTLKHVALEKDLRKSQRRERSIQAKIILFADLEKRHTIVKAEYDRRLRERAKLEKEVAELVDTAKRAEAQLGALRRDVERSRSVVRDLEVEVSTLKLATRRLSGGLAKYGGTAVGGLNGEPSSDAVTVTATVVTTSDQQYTSEADRIAILECSELIRNALECIVSSSRMSSRGIYDAGKLSPDEQVLVDRLKSVSTDMAAFLIPQSVDSHLAEAEKVEALIGERLERLLGAR